MKQLRDYFNRKLDQFGEWTIEGTLRIDELVEAIKHDSKQLKKILKAKLNK